METHDLGEVFHVVDCSTIPQNPSRFCPPFQRIEHVGILAHAASMSIGQVTWVSYCYCSKTVRFSSPFCCTKTRRISSVKPRESQPSKSAIRERKREAQNREDHSETGNFLPSFECVRESGSWVENLELIGHAKNCLFGLKDWSFSPKQAPAERERWERKTE